MTSEVDICNRALSKLGQIRITSLTDNNKAAKACNHAYEYVRDAIFRAHPWNFLMERVQLSPLVTTPPFEYDYEYQLPSDCIRLIEVYDIDYPYVVEGRKILTDYGTTLNIRYMKCESDPNQFDSLCTELIAARLAYELAEELTQSNTKKEAAARDYKDILLMAKSADALEGSPDLFEEDDWVNIRY